MSDEKTETALNELGAALRRQPSARAEVLRQATRASIDSPQAVKHGHRRAWGAAAALAACAVFVCFFLFRGGGASEAFAQAIETVAKAHTFSCREISQSVDPSGNVHVREMSYAFKEPDLERLEFVSGSIGDGEVTITDYGKHRRLQLQPKGMTAVLEDVSMMYDVEAKSGELKVAQLDTRVRDQVMKLTAEAVKDMGTTQLDGKTVRVLQSNGKESVRTVYVDPQTHQPVQIVIEQIAEKRNKYTFGSIKIDAELNDNLFALTPPAGYKLTNDQPMVPAQEHYAKMMTKMRHLTMACIEYSNDHNGDFPADLMQMKGPRLSEKAIKALLAADGQPDGEPVIVYRRPAADAKDGGNQIVFYEAPGQRLDGKLAVGMQDGHAEVMTEMEFDERMKK